MNRIIPVAMLAVALYGCSGSDSNVRITNDKPQVAVPKARSEPIFYNGKTYQLDFGPASGGAYDMVVSGMSSKQKKDAVAVATSALGYYACPDGQKGRLQNEPSYAGSKWRMQAKCG
jgi:hypothetical protein